MLWLYVQSTGDRSLLPRALPLIETELAWWQTNRTSDATGPSGTTHRLARYAVDNTAPRPEGYVEDYETVYGPVGEEGRRNLSEEAADVLFANLASGAESGLDYSAARWAKDPFASEPLETLNNVAIVPVDLNSILYNDERLLSQMYMLDGETRNMSKSQQWAEAAAERRSAIIDLCWNDDLASFYDFNTTSGEQIVRWTPATYYAYWSNIFPNSMLSNATKAQEAFASLGYIIAK